MCLLNLFIELCIFWMWGYYYPVSREKPVNAIPHLLQKGCYQQGETRRMCLMIFGVLWHKVNSYSYSGKKHWGISHGKNNRGNEIVGCRKGLLLQLPLWKSTSYKALFRHKRKHLAQKANPTLSSEAQVGPVFSCPDLLLLSLKPMSSFPVNSQAAGHWVNRGV